MKRSAIPVQLILYRPFASIGYALPRLGNEANVCTAEKKNIHCALLLIDRIGE